MEEIHNFHFGILCIKGLIFGPPFPWHRVHQFSEFLLHGTGVIEQPGGLIFLRETVQLYPDTLIELFL